MVVATKLGFRSRLCEGKVLAPLTSVVLNENDLVSFVNKCQCNAICFLLIIKNL